MIARKVTVLVGGAVFGLMLQGCPDQPEMECQVSRGPFMAKYTLLEGTGPCAEMKGEIVGMEQYFANDGEGKQDRSRSMVSIGTTTIGNAAALRGASSTDEQKLYAIGPLNTNKPTGKFCTVPTMAPAELELPELPPTPPDDPGAPAEYFKYEWSNVRILMKPSAIGEAFAAELTFTSGTTPQDACTARYHVDAQFYSKIFSGGSCAGPADPVTGEPGPPDDFQCSSNPDPAHGVTSGSGINPDFPVHCDPDLLMCVLDGHVEDL